MKTDHYDVQCIFRGIGSTGLVIFERDDVLLRQRTPLRDFTLGDVNDDFVKALKRLRDANLRFGFLSDQRGMDAGSHGLSDFAALTKVLDDLLRTNGAAPDFWLGWASPASKIKLRPRDLTTSEPEVAAIWRAMQWYDVAKTEAVFVGRSSAGLEAANRSNIHGIRYSDLLHGNFPYSVTAEAQRLSDVIGRILGLDQRQTNY
jgi:histidinol phosphatase-like enzyme